LPVSISRSPASKTAPLAGLLQPPDPRLALRVVFRNAEVHPVGVVAFHEIARILFHERRIRVRAAELLHFGTIPAAIFVPAGFVLLLMLPQSTPLQSRDPAPVAAPRPGLGIH